jgi:hypothetical protein
MRQLHFTILVQTSMEQASQHERLTADTSMYANKTSNCLHIHLIRACLGFKVLLRLVLFRYNRGQHHEWYWKILECYLYLLFCQYIPVKGHIINSLVLFHRINELQNFDEVLEPSGQEENMQTNPKATITKF